MAPQTEKIALFIDGANLYATAKSLGFDIDYKRYCASSNHADTFCAPFTIRR